MILDAGFQRGELEFATKNEYCDGRNGSAHFAQHRPLVGQCGPLHLHLALAPARLRHAGTGVGGAPELAACFGRAHLSLVGGGRGSAHPHPASAYRAVAGGMARPLGRSRRRMGNHPPAGGDEYGDTSKGLSE